MAVCARESNQSLTRMGCDVVVGEQREITVGDTLEMFIITSEGTRIETFDLKKD